LLYNEQELNLNEDARSEIRYELVDEIMRRRKTKMRALP
jgi:hypothetical protein